MEVAHAIFGCFLTLSVCLLCFVQLKGLSALTAHGKVAQNSTLIDSSWFAKLINAVAGLTVPKAWFSHFYVLYLLLMWGQFLYDPYTILSNGKYLLVWLFLTCQATRRLYESYHVTRWGNASKMHVSHYFLGLGFYMGVSIICFCGLQSHHGDSGNGVTGTGFFWTLLLVAFFAICQLDQYRNHKHLAALVKYSVPKKGLFSLVSSAHYCDEILIYFTVVLLAFTRGRLIAEDWALLSIWIFVVINLSISALETHSYYLTKFEDFHLRYAIIPGIL